MQMYVGSRKDLAIRNSKLYVSASKSLSSWSSSSLFCRILCMLIKQITRKKTSCQETKQQDNTLQPSHILLPATSSYATSPLLTISLPSLSPCHHYDQLLCPMRLMGNIANSVWDLLAAERILSESAMPDYHFNNQNQSDLSGRDSPCTVEVFLTMVIPNQTPTKAVSINTGEREFFVSHSVVTSRRN